MNLHVNATHRGEFFRITDMTNAGKRGKTCRVLRFSGWAPYAGENANDEASRSFNLCCEMMALASGVRDGIYSAVDLDWVAAKARSLVASANVSEHNARLDIEEIRGVDAPKPELLAGVEGVWSAYAGDRGVSVDDDADKFNEPSEITHHSQSANTAYAIASKVWDRVKASKTFREAVEVLRSAGWKGHYYCRMD